MTHTYSLEIILYEPCEGCPKDEPSQGLLVDKRNEHGDYAMPVSLPEII
jgi:hypothetical protein